jgi:hypothetical protein
MIPYEIGKNFLVVDQTSGGKEEATFKWRFKNEAAGRLLQEVNI